MKKEKEAVYYPVAGDITRNKTIDDSGFPLYERADPVRTPFSLCIDELEAAFLISSSVRAKFSSPPLGGGGGEVGVEALPLPLPPPLAAVSSSPVSIQALLVRTASGSGVADCQSPRSLLSRILQRGDGGNRGFRFRVRLPRQHSSSSGGGGGREERKDDAEQAAVTPRVKVVERAPELPIETPRSSLAKQAEESWSLTPQPVSSVVRMELSWSGMSFPMLSMYSSAPWGNMVSPPGKRNLSQSTRIQFCTAFSTVFHCSDHAEGANTIARLVFVVQ